jgi:hypothetical protein
LPDPVLLSELAAFAAESIVRRIVAIQRSIRPAR